MQVRSAAMAFVATLSLSSMLNAQIMGTHEVGLKNWPTPLYWQPSKTTAGSRLSPEIQLFAPQSTPNNLVFVAMTPCRVVDTRAAQNFPIPFGQPGLTPGAARSFPIQSSTLCSIPSTAQAYSFNVTVVPPGVLGYLTIYPHGQLQPNAVTLDDVQGVIVNNAAIVPAGTVNGSVDAVVNGNTDLVIDINGYFASPTDLNNNTGLGSQALASNTTGSYNVANGTGALAANTSGGANTASGAQALYSTTSGSDNTASGFQALYNNTSGNTNTASGFLALYNNTTGHDNTATGQHALFTNTTGSFNVALGDSAGYQVTLDNNIDIGHVGVSNDSNTIRIGSLGDTLPAHNRLFLAGVNGVTTGAHNAVSVMIDSNGQLGTINSSRRFKEDIHDMDDISSGLLRLRPVTYRYREPYADGSKPLDYGLIAEEVAQIYPDLVVTGAEGQAETVQYHKLTPMLLNELQKEHETVQSQVSALKKQEEMIHSLQSQVSALQEALETLAASIRR